MDRMLDGIEPRQMDEWVAFRQIEPDPEGRIIEILKRGFTALCRAWGMDLTFKDFDPAHEEPVIQMTPKQQSQAFGMWLTAARRGR